MKNSEVTIEKPSDDELALFEWLEKINPFYGGQSYLVSKIKSCGIKNTYEIVVLVDQAKSFIGVANTTSLASELNSSVVRLVREIMTRRSGEKRRADLYRLRRLGPSSATNDIHIVGEIKSILGMKKQIMIDIGDSSFNEVQVLYGLFVVWKVVEALKDFSEKRFENYGISLLLAAKGIASGRKIAWIRQKDVIGTIALSKKGKSGAEKSNAEYRALRAEVFAWLIDHYQEYKEKRALDEAADVIERQRIVVGRSWRKIRDDIIAYGKLSSDDVRAYIDKNRKLRTTGGE
ncbi:hypothetical protein KPA94_23090 [Burkholderia semiarida]|uniref:hypothetical protein n=1 Tax=Burkholderia semiarida TaxID=2843303 RepID=UPI0023DE17EF|nr:hypothetical protein [Burkholderia semiarida]MDF3116320.1 hypothetical protein [Burkholderia semiarida]